MSDDYDLVVIGAGPAGSTLATLVKKYNPDARVLIIEKSKFPRHHVGESLLPGMLPVLREMGVYDKINRAGFPKKVGATFVWGRSRKPWEADFIPFSRDLLKRYRGKVGDDLAWQVLRSRYDDILLRHAQSVGVEVWLECRALEDIERRGQVRGVKVEISGKIRTIRSRLLADCSGQNGLLSKRRKTRSYCKDLKSVAGYAYFRNAKWKFKYSGHPDKTNIFICSVPEGWFWYIPVAKNLVSVGLVSKANYVRRKGVKDFQAYFFAALRSCKEIWPLLSEATVADDIDANGRTFFTASDWSYVNETACGPGWLTAGDAAFFIDPLLSSGVVMAHISGHKAAYTINSVWRQKDPYIKTLLWADFDRFVKEAGRSFRTMVQYWYHHEPNARSWWKVARQALHREAPVDLSDKLSFIAVAAGMTYHYERKYACRDLGLERADKQTASTHESMRLVAPAIIRSSGRWDGERLNIVKVDFFGAPKKKLRVRKDPYALKGSDIPRWVRRPRKSVTFLPDRGVLCPISRLDFGHSSKRILPRPYMAAADLIDGRRTMDDIGREIRRVVTPNQCLSQAELASMLADLHRLGAISVKTWRRRRFRTKPFSAKVLKYLQNGA